MAQTSTPAKGRIPSLDLLRGIAVLMVLVVHAPWPVAWRTGVPERFLRMGHHGVDLFFVLSGFLISGLLFAEYRRTGRIQLVRFWLRRGFKIWPAYYAAYGLTLLIVCGLALREGKPMRGELLGALPNLVFVQNYLWVECRWFASWSLAIEEHFYTALPVFLCAGISLGLGLRAVPWMCLLVCLLSPLARALSGDPVAVYIQTHFRAETLCYGVLLGYVYHHWPETFASLRRWWPVLAVLPFLALVVPFYHGWDERFMRVAGITALSLAFAGLVALAVAYPEMGKAGCFPVRWLVQALSWVGVYSFGVYLAQATALLLTERSNALLTTTLNLPLDLRVPVFVGFAVLGGFLLARIVEQPFLALRERWVPRPAPVGRANVPPLVPLSEVPSPTTVCS